ncbi:MAG: hypothetical protein J7L95_00005 [Prolixibacteraceae bacterium]|nr:hypothetical protein [Prolixibacteraceae bacterium]
MKKYLLTISLIITFFGTSYSQEIYQIRQAMDFFRSNKLQTGEWRNTLTESDIEGSPYLNNDFLNGTIYTTSKFRFENVPLRYNIYNDQLEFRTPDNEVQAMAAPEIVEKVEFGTTKMAYIPYSNVKKIRRGFFTVLLEGKASLYQRAEVVFKDATEPGAYKEAEPAKFIRKPNTYFIRIGMEQAKRVGNKKELVDLFPDHKKEIAAFIKKNKIKTNKPDSLKKLVVFYNSL